jgi:drug/metabolite transporter (DMT)-like permease
LGKGAWAAVAGAFAIAFSGIFYRLAEVSPATGAFFRCAYALPPLVLLAAWERHRYGPRAEGQRLLAVIAGAFFAADLLFWHYSIEAVGAGLSTVIANLQVVLVALLAWALLSERPARTTLLAVPVVLLGAVLISGVVGAGAYGDDPALGVVFGVATALAYSGFLLVLRAGNRDVRRPAGPLRDATAASAAVVAVAGVALGDLDLAPSWPAHGWLVALALSGQVVGWLLISVSLPRLPAAATSIVLMLQPVASVLLAMAILDEDPSAVQLGGAAIILAGVAIASVRSRTLETAQKPAA